MLYDELYPIITGYLPWNSIPQKTSSIKVLEQSSAVAATRLSNTIHFEEISSIMKIHLWLDGVSASGPNKSIDSFKSLCIQRSLQ